MRMTLVRDNIEEGFVQRRMMPLLSARPSD